MTTVNHRFVDLLDEIDRAASLDDLEDAEDLVELCLANQVITQSESVYAHALAKRCRERLQQAQGACPGGDDGGSVFARLADLSGQ